MHSGAHTASMPLLKGDTGSLPPSAGIFLILLHHEGWSTAFTLELSAAGGVGRQPGPHVAHSLLLDFVAWSNPA